MILSVPVWLLTILYVSILPSVGNLAVSGSREDMYGIYKKIVFILSFLSAWAAIGYGCLIQDFVGLWLGAEFRLSETAVVLFAVYIYLYGEVMVIKIMRESIGLWNKGRIFAGIEMAANLILNVLLARWLGVEGVILSTVITMLCISIPAENRILFSQYFTGRETEKMKSLAVNAAWAVGTALAAGIWLSVERRKSKSWICQHGNYVLCRRSAYENRTTIRESSPDRHRGHVVHNCYPEKKGNDSKWLQAASISYENYEHAIRQKGFDAFRVEGKQMKVDTTDFSKIDMEELFL